MSFPHGGLSCPVQALEGFGIQIVIQNILVYVCEIFPCRSLLWIMNVFVQINQRWKALVSKLLLGIPAYVHNDFHVT